MAPVPCYFAIPENYKCVVEAKVVDGPTRAEIEASRALTQEQEYPDGFHPIFYADDSEYLKESGRRSRIPAKAHLWPAYCHVISTHWIGKNNVHILGRDACPFPHALIVVKNYNYQAKKGNIEVWEEIQDLSLLYKSGIPSHLKIPTGTELTVHTTEDIPVSLLAETLSFRGYRLAETEGYCHFYEEERGIVGGILKYLIRKGERRLVWQDVYGETCLFDPDKLEVKKGTPLQVVRIANTR